MAIDLKKLSVEELLALTKDAAALLESKKAERLTAVRKQIKDLIAVSGFSAADVLRSYMPSSPRVPPAPHGSKLPVKYSKGRDAWTGRGRQPAWLTAHLEAGGTLEQVEVKA